MGGFSTVTPSGGSVNVTSVAQAVWSYTPRSLTDIQSLVSAIQNNDPSLLSTLSDLMYVPAPYYAGQVSATQVAAFVNNMILNQGMANAVANFISNNVYGLWTTSFTSQLVTNQYMSATAIDMLLASVSMTANYAQFILYQLAQNYNYNKWIYTVTASAPSSITFSTNVRLSTNVLIAQNITIASGVTVTCGTTTCFFIAQSFNNYGTIVNPNGAPAGTAWGGGGESGYGGTGGGGIVVIAITAALGTINVSGSPGISATTPYFGAAVGYPGLPGIFYTVSGVTILGGTGGIGTNGYAGAAGINGGGGGGTDSKYVGGSGGIANVYSFSSPNAMLTYILQGLSDWWLINVFGKAPSSTTPLAFMYGSGGGGGASASGYEAAGGGGGGAGEVVVYGYNILSGTINAVGGTGGSAIASCTGCYAGGGGGGGGGLVFILYGATSGNITANVAGGAGGTGYGASGYNTPENNGSAGVPGTAYIAAVTVNG
jgi:hypothetical protein